VESHRRLGNAAAHGGGAHGRRLLRGVAVHASAPAEGKGGASTTSSSVTIRPRRTTSASTSAAPGRRVATAPSALRHTLDETYGILCYQETSRRSRWSWAGSRRRGGCARR
jgi:hypothetical protein